MILIKRKRRGRENIRRLLGRRHQGIKAPRHRGKAEDKTSADYADYADKKRVGLDFRLPSRFRGNDEGWCFGFG